MKLGKALVVVALLALGAGAAFAQSIDLTGDPAGLTCQGTFPVGGATPMFIVARLGGQAAAGITGAEFWVSGLPAGWLTIVTPNPASSVALGNPFATLPPLRANIAFPGCMPPDANGLVPLYTITVIAMSPATDTFLSVLVANPPSNVAYTTPIFTLCDAPEYTAVPAFGGQFIINPVARHCTVGVEDTTWGQVKSLFGN